MTSSIRLLPLCSLLVLLSCGKEEQEAVQPTVRSGPWSMVNDTATYHGLFSLAVGNRWIYDRQDPDLGPETVLVERATLSDGLQWWKLKHPTFAWSCLYDSFAVRNDSVYIMTSSDPIGYFPQKRLYAPGDSAENFGFLFGGDVGVMIRIERRSQPVTVPAGTFSGFISYAYGDNMQFDSLVIVPGIGVVYHSFVNRAPSPASVHFSSLREYSLRSTISSSHPQQ